MSSVASLGTRLRRLTVLLVAAWPFAAWAAASALVVETQGGRAEAVAVLAGSAAYVERASLATKVFKDGRASRIVLTDDGQRGGWSLEEQRNPRFVEMAAKELRARGVPAESIEVVAGTVSGTYDEAARLRSHAEAKGLRSIIVVTSAYQMRRARWTFERVFRGSGVAVSFESVPPGDETPRPLTWWLRAEGWRMVAGEYVKMLYYLARY